MGLDALFTVVFCRNVHVIGTSQGAGILLNISFQSAIAILPTEYWFPSLNTDVIDNE